MCGVCVCTQAHACGGVHICFGVFMCVVYTCMHAHEHIYVAEDVGCPVLSFSAILRHGLLLNLELDWRPVSPRNPPPFTYTALGLQAFFCGC